MMKRYVLLIAALVGAVSCNNEVTGLEPPSDPAEETFAASLGVDLTQMTLTGDGLYYRDLVTGAADAPEVTATTDSVRVTYAGYLKDGRLFDSGTNVKFLPLALIPGFRLGLMGMKEGGKRKIVVPSALGYGGQSIQAKNAKIPRQSTLVFDIDLLKVYNPAPTTP
jgi:FKBP-type peptidyl-prolyl cis-trans isomerase FkpA